MPSSVSLSRLVRLARAADCGFLSEAAARSLARVPDVFGETLSWCGLECRFDDRDDRVDLMVCIDRAQASRLARSMEDACRGRRFAWEKEWIRAWADSARPAAPYIWFEFDLAPGAPEIPLLLFVPFETESGRPPARNDVEAVVSEAHMLSDTGLSAAPERALRAVLGELPPGGWPLHLASLRPRGIDGSRLVVSVPTPAAADYAAAIGWPGSLDRLAAVIRRVGRFGSHLNLSFDVTGRVGGRLGIDCFFPSSPARDPRWQPVLAILTEAGAVPDRLEAFRRWYGPADTTQGAIFRNPFVKLVLEGDGSPGGKAYLAFHPLPAMPGASASAIRRGSSTPRSRSLA